jgi:hypothetical protein
LSKPHQGLRHEQLSEWALPFPGALLCKSFLNRQCWDGKGQLRDHHKAKGCSSDIHAFPETLGTKQDTIAIGAEMLEESASIDVVGMPVAADSCTSQLWREPLMERVEHFEAREQQEGTSPARKNRVTGSPRCQVDKVRVIGFG